MTRTTRRRLLLASGTVAAAVAGCLSRPDDGNASGNTPTGTSTSTESPPGTATTTGNTTREPQDGETPEGVAWQSDVGSPVHAIAADGAAVYVGTEAGGVLALASDGRRRWRAALDGPLRQVEPAGDLVFAVSGESALYSNHRVAALDAETGERRWAFAPEEWWLDVLGTHDGTVYVATSDDAIEPDGQTLYAVSRDDGSVRWSGEVGDNAGGLVAVDAVYVPSYGHVDAYDHGGSLRWGRTVAEYGFNSIATVGDVVAFAGVEDDGRRQSAIGLSTADGSTQWTVGGWFVTSLVAHEGRLFAGGKHVVEVDPATGEVGWQFDPGGSIYDAPVVDGALFTSGQSVHAVGIADGTRRWTFEPDLYLVDPVAAVGDALYVHGSKSKDDRDRHLFALDPAEGGERWRFVADSRLTASVMVGDRLVAGSEGGAVFGFE